MGWSFSRKEVARILTPLRTDPSVRRLTRLALLTALALVIHLLEGQLPAPLPIPGVKLGLANVVTLYAMFTVGPVDTFLVLLSRILLGSVFSGRATVFLYSLAGGLLCYAVTCLLRRLPRGQLWVAGIIGGMCHNVAQLAVAVLLTHTPALAVYLPWLLLCGMGAGLFTGLCAQFLLKKLPEKLQKW